MSLGDRPRRKRIEDVRCPTVKGLPDDIYHMLHHSFVDILKMRRSIETVDVLIDASRAALPTPIGDFLLDISRHHAARRFGRLLQMVCPTKTTSTGVR